jgi:hypothetical protein
MDILKQLARLIEAVEDDIEDGEDEETDDQAKARAEKERKIARGEMSRPDQEIPDKGGALAPASKYASGLKNTGAVGVPRTGEGDRPLASATAFKHVNDLMKMVSEFLDKHGDIAQVKHSTPQGSYLDQHKADLEKQRRKDAGEKVGGDKLKQFSKGSTDKVKKLMDDCLDPAIGPERRKIAQNVFWQFLSAIAVGRKKAWQEKVKKALEEKITQMTTIVRHKFAQQGKKIDEKVLQKKVAMKVKETFQMDLDDKTKAKNKEYDHDLFMVKEAMMTISKQLQILAREEANYEYVPGAFGAPPRIQEKGADKPEPEEDEDDEESAPSGVTVRKPGQAFGSNKKSTGKPMQIDTSGDADDDAEFEDIWSSIGKKESIDRFLYNMMEVASADYKPRWWDSL